jgi:membrane protease YdiL (CAAX protease family)
MLFGLYHWQQGVFGMIPAALGGLLWTFLLWRFKGNLWYAIISHAVYDTIALIMIYWGISI